MKIPQGIRHNWHSFQTQTSIETAVLKRSCWLSSPVNFALICWIESIQSIITCHAAMLWQGYFRENQRNIAICWTFVFCNIFSREVLLPPLSTPENAPLQEPKGGGGGLNWTLTTDGQILSKVEKIPCEIYYIEPYWTILNPYDQNQSRPVLALSIPRNSIATPADSDVCCKHSPALSCDCKRSVSEQSWQWQRTPSKYVESQQFLWECRPLFLWSSPQSPAFDHLSPLPSSLLDWILCGVYSATCGCTSL